jgi:hypothetical protein
MMRSWYNLGFVRGTFATLLIAVFALGPLSIELQPQRAHAQACAAATALITSWATDFLTSIGLGFLGIGESVPISNSTLEGNSTMDIFITCVLNPIAWTAAKILIANATDSIVAWIEGGFEGQPAFLEDLPGFMLNIADEAVGDFLFTDTTFDFLCSPFSADIQIGLALQYFKPRTGSQDSSFSCSLSDAWVNSQAALDFLSGDFTAGGWQQWFDISVNENNNPYGNFLKAGQEMSLRISSAQGEKTLRLGWSDGWHDMECPEGSGRTCTPGKFIEQHVQSYTDSPLASLKIADSVDEILYALAEQLVMSFFSASDGGLLGASRGTNASYNNNNERRNEWTAAFPTLQIQNLLNSITTAITQEQAKPTSAERAQIITDLQTLRGEVQTLLDTITAHTTDWQSLLASYNARYRDILARIRALDSGGGTATGGITAPPPPTLPGGTGGLPPMPTGAPTSPATTGAPPLPTSGPPAP